MNGEMIVAREHKGKSRLIFADEYVALDIETTGLSPVYCEIIEIGAVRVEKGEVTEQFEELIRPTEPISDFITGLTGITNEELERNGRQPDIVLSEFSEFIGDALLVGQNVNFDINFLYDGILKHCGQPLRNDFADTLRLSSNIFPELSDHKLGTLKKAFGIAEDVAHRGLSDCIDAMRCYEYMRGFSMERGLLVPEEKGYSLDRKKLKAMLSGTKAGV
ncbi:MAG: PolC-type DNA polymerase III [Oscillospiraceae bacterium]